MVKFGGKSSKYSWRKMKIYREKSSKTNLPGNLLCRSLHLRFYFCFWCATNGMIIHPWFIQCFKRIIKKAFYANWIFPLRIFLHFMEIFPRFFIGSPCNGVWWLFTLRFFCGLTINSTSRGGKFVSLLCCGEVKMKLSMELFPFLKVNRKKILLFNFLFQLLSCRPWRRQSTRRCICEW